jgi:hypothetical protein
VSLTALAPFTKAKTPSLAFHVRLVVRYVRPQPPTVQPAPTLMPQLTFSCNPLPILAAVPVQLSTSRRPTSSARRAHQDSVTGTPLQIQQAHSCHARPDATRNVQSVSVLWTLSVTHAQGQITCSHPQQHVQAHVQLGTIRLQLETCVN